MNVIILQAPPFEPLSLEEVYLHLRLTTEGSPPTHPEDALLASNIAAARRLCEAITHRSLVQRTLRLVLSGFRQRSGINLLRPPVLEVQAVRYYDSDNTLQTVAESAWYLTDDVMPQLRFVSNWAAPALYDRPDAVRIDYVAGYAPDGSPATTQEEYAANVPEDIKAAMKLIVGDLYEVREAGLVGTTKTENPAVAALLADHIVHVSV